MSEQPIKVSPILVTAFVTAVFAIQAWTLIEVVNLKIEVAKISEHMKINSPDGAVGFYKSKKQI